MKLKFFASFLVIISNLAYADYLEFKTNSTFQAGTHLVTPPGKHLSFKLVNQVTEEIFTLGKYKSSRSGASSSLVAFDPSGNNPDRIIGQDFRGRLEISNGFFNQKIGEGPVRNSAPGTSGQSQRVEAQVNYLFLTLSSDSAPKEEFGKIVAWSGIKKSPDRSYFVRSTRIKPSFRCAAGVIHSTRESTRSSLENTFPGIDWNGIEIEAEGNEAEFKEHFHIFVNLISYDAVLTDRDGTLCFAYNMEKV